MMCALSIYYRNIRNGVLHLLSSRVRSMGARKLPILFHLLFASLTAAAAQPHFLAFDCPDTYGNYTSNSTYRENLNTLLSNITSDTRIRYGFYNFSSGQGSDEVHGIGLCRGDATFSTCHTCLNDSSYRLRKLCPYQREAIGWYDNCILRYSNRSIFGVRNDYPAHFTWSMNNASDVDQLDKRLGSLLKNLQDKASKGDSERKYATGSDNITDFETANALVQCTPDLSQVDCFNCIGDSINNLPKHCAGKTGCRVIKPSCTLRYEFYQFYTPEADTSPSPSPPPSSLPNTTTTTKNTGKGSNTAKIAIIVAATTVLFVAVFALIIYCVKRKNSSKKLKNEDEFERVDSLEYDCSTIRAATGNFSEEKKLGCGGFGAVYQGTLSNGQEIAVKRLDINSRQGEVEFKNEVLLVAKLQHRNLVRLLGFCLEGEERLLIYEFVPNRSLDYFLFDSERRMLLDWEKRYKIISGIVRGLVYLHEDSRLRIIHRDLNASNILLDSEMSAKIADFGMAKLFQMDQTQANTSRIAGT